MSKYIIINIKNSKKKKRPDTYVSELSGESGFLNPTPGSLLLVQSNGQVIWTHPSVMKIRCKMNIAWFPFDMQICAVTFGSWAHTVNFINYTSIFYIFTYLYT